MSCRCSIATLPQRWRSCALATSPALDAGDFERFESQARELIGTEGFHIICATPTAASSLPAHRQQR
jgi:hypothetical protein